MDCAYKDDLLIRGMDKRGAIAYKQDELQRATDFGIRLATV